MNGCAIVLWRNQFQFWLSSAIVSTLGEVNFRYLHAKWFSLVLEVADLAQWIILSSFSHFRPSIELTPVARSVSVSQHHVDLSLSLLPTNLIQFYRLPMARLSITPDNDSSFALSPLVVATICFMESSWLIWQIEALFFCGKHRGLYVICVMFN